jgi:DNA repair protein RecO (recombination protein O)
VAEPGPTTMPLVATPSIVLQAFPYSESSKILRLLTDSHGVCSVIAKGAQRPKSRFGGVLETFTEGEARFHFREGRELHTLGGFDLTRSRQVLGRDLMAFAGASLIAEMVLRYGTLEPQPSLFRLVSTALDRIAGADSELLQEVVIADAWLVISLLGFRPQLDACVSCDRALADDEVARFDIDGGGVACLRCRPHGRPFDAVARAELRAMIEGELITVPFMDQALHRALVRRFLTAHLARDQALRSLPLFLQQIS